MYKIDDVVLYSIQGVCRVKEIVEKTVDGISTCFYVLSPVFAPSSQVFVPLDNEQLVSRMRPIISFEEMSRIVDGMADCETIWISESNTRKEKYKDIVLNGTREDLRALIKTLHLHKKNQLAHGKKLHLTDERYLKEAEKMLYTEIAFLFNMQPAQIPGFLRTRMAELNADEK